MSYKVTANIDDGKDYFWHEERSFEVYCDAYEFWDTYLPDEDDVRKAIVEWHENSSWDQDPDDYMLQIAMWDEDGNEIEFWNKGYTYDECKEALKKGAQNG